MEFTMRTNWTVRHSAVTQPARQWEEICAQAEPAMTLLRNLHVTVRGVFQNTETAEDNRFRTLRHKCQNDQSTLLSRQSIPAERQGIRQCSRQQATHRLSVKVCRGQLQTRGDFSSLFFFQYDNFYLTTFGLLGFRCLTGFVVASKF